MNAYHPDINTGAHSVEWLQARRDLLARAGLTGSRNEKQSAQRKAELAAIEAGLKAKGIAVKQVARARVLPASESTDVARAQAVWPPAQAPRPAGLSGYSAAVHAVSTDFNPPKHHQYV